MYCSQCGAQNDDNAFRCTSCQQVLRRPPQAGAAGAGGPAKTYLAQSIIVTLLCCMPAGIPAIVYSSMAMSKNSEGDYEGAARCAKKASTWGWVSFGVGLTVSVLYGIVAALGNGAR
jgi:hypothetical protein